MPVMLGGQMEVITVRADFRAHMAQYSTSAELADTRIGAGGMSAEKNARTWQRSTKGWDERGRQGGLTSFQGRWALF
jgi:hypothetical protein